MVATVGLGFLMLTSYSFVLLFGGEDIGFRVSRVVRIIFAFVFQGCCSSCSICRTKTPHDTDDGDDGDDRTADVSSAMADAVEDAAVMCYGVSKAYKESTNCRMEAQYAFQQQKDMIPLMLEDGYRAKGWLGMMLGVRLWYGFYGPVLDSEDAFEVKMDELCREVGARGKV